MASGESSDKKIIRIGGKLSEHFAFLNADAPSDGASKISCLHCKKQFAYRGSNTSLTYYLQHKHPMQYPDIIQIIIKVLITWDAFTLTGGIENHYKYQRSVLAAM